MKRKKEEEVTRVAESVGRVWSMDHHSIALGDPQRVVNLRTMAKYNFSPRGQRREGREANRLLDGEEIEANGLLGCTVAKRLLADRFKPNSQLVHRPISLNPKGREEWRSLI